MKEEIKLMTNRQLSQLCAKGLCEWANVGESLVRHFYDYLLSTSDEPVSKDVVIRPYEKLAFTNADENGWYQATEDAYTAIIVSDRTRHTFGF